MLTGRTGLSSIFYAMIHKAKHTKAFSESSHLIISFSLIRVGRNL